MLITVSARRRSPLWEYPTSWPYNAPADRPLITPTYDGSGESTHPDVIDFAQTTLGTWRGWRFWMVMTPFPGSQIAYENPSILVSRDGIDWQVPAGLSNPIYPQPGAGWGSDTDLHYDPSTDRLVMVYRPTRTQQAYGTSSDGVTWSSLTYATKAAWADTGQELLSPAVVREADGSWRIWGVATEDGTIRVYHTANPAAWGSPTTCVGTVPASPWHLDVIRHEGRYWMCYDNIQAGLFVGTSLDGVNWAFNERAIQTKGTLSQVYRPTIQPHENGTHMRVWFGADMTGSPHYWRVLHTWAPKSEWPAPPG